MDYRSYNCCIAIAILIAIIRLIILCGDVCDVLTWHAHIECGMEHIDGFSSFSTNYHSGRETRERSSDL